MQVLVCDGCQINKQHPTDQAKDASGLSDLRAQGSRVCHKRLHRQLVSNVPFPAP